LKKARVLIFVVAYNAADHITKVLSRIPLSIYSDYNSEIMLIDDASIDDTFIKANSYALSHPELKIIVQKNSLNLGYGGNQKLGYNFTLERQFDLVVLLHGDGQYAPEYLDQMIRPIIENKADVVLGSRMLNKGQALKGKMPMYKWIANQFLTFVQNTILGTRFAEFHTGYRAYAADALSSIPFNKNSDYFDFDTDIIIQLIDQKKRFIEIPIPTFYGDEISYVNGIKYGLLILYTTIKSRLVKIGWLSDERFSYSKES
jgi:glycosyltransferase involved in cell wall biosynthesis